MGKGDVAQPFFSIVVVTHNRPHLLSGALRCLAAQSFDDFEVILIDNASEQPVEQEARAILGERVRHYRMDRWIDPGDCWEFSLTQLRGRYALIFADDDGLVPSALERVHTVITRTDTPLLAVGFAYYVHPEGRPIEGLRGNRVRFHPKVGSGALLWYEGRTVAEVYFASWGIGQRSPGEGLPASHSSAFFVSTELIQKTRRESGLYFVKPFADVGGIGAILRTDRVPFVDQPLALIGMAARRAMDGSLPGGRHYWRSFPIELRHVPFQAHTFINLGVESHLRVVRANVELLNDYSCDLQPWYYERHLQEIVADRPWTHQTLQDIWEWIQVVSHLPDPKRRAVMRQVYERYVVSRKHVVRGRISRLKRRLLGQSIPPLPKPPPDEWIAGEEAGFRDVVTCAKWLEQRLPPLIVG